MPHFLRLTARSGPTAVASVLCHLLISRAAVANEQWEATAPWESTEPWEAAEPLETADTSQLVRGQLLPLATAWPPWPSPPPPPLPAPSPSAPSPLRAVVSDGMRLELRFLGGHGRAPNAHTLLVELGSALGVEPQGRIKVQETHHAPNSPLSYATFDLLPPNTVGMSAQPSAPELAARLTKLLGGMQCESMLDATEIWSSDGCSKGRASVKLAVDGKYDTLANGTYPPSWRACARAGSYEYEQTLRVQLRTPLPPGQPLLLRLVAPENGTDAFDNQVMPRLGSNGGGGIPQFDGGLGPAAPCVATTDGAVELQDGGVSVAVCSSSATANSEWLYLTGRGRGRVGEEGAGGLALAEVQACRPDSSSRLYALTADGSFLYPALARVDVRAGLQQIGVSTGGDDYQCGELGEPCVRIIRPSVRTQLMPELVARRFNAGSTEEGNNGTNIIIVMLALLSLAACTFGLARPWCTWRGDLREHDQLEREETYDDVGAADRIDSLGGKSKNHFTLDDYDMAITMTNYDEGPDNVMVNLRSDEYGAR